MYILGLSGGSETLFSQDFGSTIQESFAHDGAAALLKDGVIVAAVEEERLNRIKHSNRFPIMAIESVLAQAEISLEEVDYIAIYINEDFLKFGMLVDHIKYTYSTQLWEPRTLINNRLSTLTLTDVSKKIFFVGHHNAHTYSSYPFSGFDNSLSVIIDGLGEEKSGAISYCEGSNITLLSELERSQSIGLFYLCVIQFLGFKLFDEFKVMGLAPYGDPSVFRELFKNIVELQDNGQYEIKSEHLIYLSFLSSGLQPRKKGKELTQKHKDLAAALQECVENIVFHILNYWRIKTGAKNLCLAGGVAHNCTMNGKILMSDMFDKIFVQPASHDAGCALGAAVYANLVATGNLIRTTLTNINLGPPIDDKIVVKDLLEQWSDWIIIDESEDPTEDAADLIYKGKVIGWVQGKSEFGPRALGNRSILADPRPAENRERINSIVKKREGFRPFALSILESEVENYFDVNNAKADLGFMTYVIPIKTEYKNKLGATTHIDGTSRVQTVSEGNNSLYYKLINSFYNKTNIAGVLNTSFNNNVEPIVDNITDSIVCFLTTDLDVLFIDSFCCHKKGDKYDNLLKMYLRLPVTSKIEDVSFCNNKEELIRELKISHNHENRFEKISDNIGSLLLDNNLKENIGKGINKLGISKGLEDLMDEVFKLWQMRLITISPCP